MRVVSQKGGMTRNVGKLESPLVFTRRRLDNALEVLEESIEAVEELNHVVLVVANARKFRTRFSHRRKGE